MRVFERPGDRPGLRKVLFPIAQDEDGYPGFSIESMWAEPTTDGSYRLDNVPFFVNGLSYNDIFEVRKAQNGEIWFARIKERGGHSTIRIYFDDLRRKSRLIKMLHEKGGRIEQSHLTRLLAVDIPPNVDRDALLLELQSERGTLKIDIDDARVQ